MDQETLLKGLNAPEKQQRLEALRGLRKMLDEGQIAEPERTTDTNNHVHTTYSFSPYSPSAAVYYAYMSGRCAGIHRGRGNYAYHDHDRLRGTRELCGNSF